MPGNEHRAAGGREEAEETAGRPPAVRDDRARDRAAARARRRPRGAADRGVPARRPRVHGVPVAAVQPVPVHADARRHAVRRGDQAVRVPGTRTTFRRVVSHRWIFLIRLCGP